MTGVQRNFITEYTSSTDNWKFIFPTQSWGAIENADNAENDVKFKQIAYAELNFSSATAVTMNTLILRDSNGIILDNDHVELVSTPGTGVTNYKIIFW